MSRDFCAGIKGLEAGVGIRPQPSAVTAFTAPTVSVSGGGLGRGELAAIYADRQSRIASGRLQSVSPDGAGALLLTRAPG